FPLDHPDLPLRPRVREAAGYGARASAGRDLPHFLRGRLLPLLRLRSPLAVGLVMLLLPAGPFAALAQTPIRVGSKNFTEQLVLGELILQALAAHGLPVENRLSLGGTAVVRQALETGEIDVYAEYTGTALLVHF